jgi:AraC-like DNA-binding protein
MSMARLSPYIWTKSVPSQIPVLMLTSSLFDPASVRCEWLWVYDALVPMTETWSKEILVPASLFFVITGRGKIKADGRTFDLPPGSAFLAAPGQRRQWFADGTRLLSVGYRATWPDGAPLFGEGLNTDLKTTTLTPLKDAVRKLFRGVHGAKRTVPWREATRPKALSLRDWSLREAAFRKWFAEYITTLLQLGIQPTPRLCPSDERINEILRRLDAWPLAKPMIVNEVASGLHIGARRLEQLLATELGITPHSRLNTRRVEAARHLLSSTTTPLKEIAHELGLRHPSHFTKWFRQHTGLSPSAYRRGDAMWAA